MQFALKLLSQTLFLFGCGQKVFFFFLPAITIHEEKGRGEESKDYQLLHRFLFRVNADKIT